MPREALRCARCRADKARVLERNHCVQFSTANSTSVKLGTFPGLRSDVFVAANTTTRVLLGLSSTRLR